jgi:hypothetical protein
VWHVAGAQQGGESGRPVVVVRDAPGEPAGERRCRGIRPVLSRQAIGVHRGGLEARVIERPVHRGEPVAGTVAGAVGPVGVRHRLTLVEHLVHHQAGPVAEHEGEHRRVIAGRGQRGQILRRRGEAAAGDVGPLGHRAHLLAA